MGSMLRSSYSFTAAAMATEILPRRLRPKETRLGPRRALAVCVGVETRRSLFFVVDFCVGSATHQNLLRAQTKRG